MERDPLDVPTAEEFEQARQRELARLNIRVSSIVGKTYHTPEDVELLKQDTLQQQDQDRDTVRRWSATSEKFGGGSKK
jgi:hypothetical protein